MRNKKKEEEIPATITRGKRKRNEKRIRIPKNNNHVNT